MEYNSNIPIKNIYYMLAYTYDALHLKEYNEVGNENFDNCIELYSKILSIGIPVLVRGGLNKEYISINEKSTTIRGKIDINNTIKQNALVDKKIVVVYDEFSEDILINQIIKSTLLFLVKNKKIKKEFHKVFHGLLPYFSEVSNIEISLTNWKKVKYNRQNIRYQFIIDICRFLYEELLISDQKSGLNVYIGDETLLSTLYEKFVFSLYKKETDYIVSRPLIKWKIDNEYSDGLPIMKTDIVLQNGQKTLIIDTKFYSNNMNIYENSNATHKSNNMYQIMAYVNNWPVKENEIISGMLLYARTINYVQPNHAYKINGYDIYIKNLDLNQDFSFIKESLINQAKEIFNYKSTSTLFVSSKVYT